MKKDFLNQMKKALTGWYGFRENSRIYYADSENGVPGEGITEAGSYDYVVCTMPAEGFDDIRSGMEEFKRLLKADGILLIAANNRLGLRYFCGDKNPYTGRVCDRSGIHTKAELAAVLGEAGYVKTKFYSVFPGLENPSHIFAEGYTPNEDLANRLCPAYHSPETVFFEEERLYRDLADNDVFHHLANAFLIEASCSEEAVFSDVLQVTSSAERKPENAFYTIIHDNGTVTKENIYSEGAKRFKQMEIYAGDLRAHGLDVAAMRRTEKGISMPFIKAPTGQLAMKDALLRDRDEFLGLMDEFRDCIMMASDIEYVDVKLGPIVRYAYIDMVPLNSFFVDGRFIFFDQEFRLEHYPLNVLLFRMVATFYAKNENLNSVIPMVRILERYGLLENREQWHRMEWEFLTPLRNEKELAEYHSKIRRDDGLTVRNRNRMNFSADRHERVFAEVFSGCDRKDVYLFGSGRFAERFLDWYGPVLPIRGVLDNNSGKWGKMIYGRQIMSPAAVRELDAGSYKVVICIKDCLPVIRQLDGLGVADYSVYDGKTVYPRSLGMYQKSDGEPLCINGFHGGDGDQSSALPPKPYHVGYISGVFDLFHKGHLNLLKSAKEKCDYLIVGVVSDGGVRRFKHMEPFIPFEERVEMVAACRYVDKAVEIPLERRDVRSAYALYHFDCQFCGSDYLEDPVFMRDREWLKSLGSNMEVLPYTESTSSTKIKELIEKELL